MTERLILAARCALADLLGVYLNDGLSRAEEVTIVELYEALRELGQDLSDYQDDYEHVKNGLKEDVDSDVE